MACSDSCARCWFASRCFRLATSFDSRPSSSDSVLNAPSSFTFGDGSLDFNFPTEPVREKLLRLRTEGVDVCRPVRMLSRATGIGLNAALPALVVMRLNGGDGFSGLLVSRRRLTLVTLLPRCITCGDRLASEPRAEESPLPGPLRESASATSNVGISLRLDEGPKCTCVELLSKLLSGERRTATSSLLSFASTCSISREGIDLTNTYKSNISQTCDVEMLKRLLSARLTGTANLMVSDYQAVVLISHATGCITRPAIILKLRAPPCGNHSPCLCAPSVNCSWQFTMSHLEEIS